MRAVGRAADGALGAIGFQRQGLWGLYGKPVRDGVFAWLGLNTSHSGGLSGRDLEINPFMGVRHEAVETLLEDLRGPREPRFKAWNATYAVQLGYLMPEGRARAWGAGSAVQALSEFDDMAVAIQRWGLPMVLANADLEGLARTLETTRFGVPDQNRYRLVVVYLLLDRPGDARRLIQAFPRRGLRGLVLRRYETFVDNLEERLASTR